LHKSAMLFSFYKSQPQAMLF